MPPLSATRPLSDRAQRPVDGGRAHRQQMRANLRHELEVAVPLHRLDQDRHQRAQPLAADSVRGFPEHDQRLAHRRIVYLPLGARPGSSTGTAGAQQAHRVLAMQTADRHEFVKDASAPAPVARGVTCG